MISRMGLQMPFEEEDIELSEMGLKMPSKVDADFIEVSFWGFLFVLFEQDSAGEC